MDTIPLLPTQPDPAKKVVRSSVSGSGADKKRVESSSTARILLLQNMVTVATNLVSSQLEAFSTRLADELFRLSDQAVRLEDAKISLEAHQLIKRNSAAFYRLVSGQINAALSKEISVFNTKKRVKKEDLYLDATSQTYEQMESRILLQHTSKALEVVSAESLVMLNTLIGRLLNRMPVDISQNPFRPDIFVNAVFQAWKELDQHGASHLVVLRLLQPAIFLQLTPILDGINQALMAKGILPDIDGSMNGTGSSAAYLPLPASFTLDPYLGDKLKRVFSGEHALELPIPLGAGLASMEQDSKLDLEDALSDQEVHARIAAEHDQQSVDRQFFEDLLFMQKAFTKEEPARFRRKSRLRDVFNAPSALNLTVVERNTIELLARMFDYILADISLSDDVKSMLAQLQFPVLRVALSDKEFFLRESHPARTLIDMLGSSGIILDRVSQQLDPLLGVIGDVVERVQHEFETQIDFFSDVVSDLENFLKDEEQKAEQAISLPVKTALSEEKMRIAREFAAHDVAIRVETGEVAGFLETFLLDQWIRILTIAHSVKDEKPHALENALKTMDDLIWSLKPKNSPEERKELITKLPSMLSLLNAWLNAIRWDEPERVLFFSKLSERHAAMARAPLELSPRRQLEIAVNIAQRASNRRLDRFVTGRRDQADEDASKQVEALERGTWLDFTDDDDHVTRYKLAWISPKRTGFIFTNRQGLQAFSMSAEELMTKCRDGLVTTILENSLVDRALTYALRDLPL